MSLYRSRAPPWEGLGTCSYKKYKTYNTKSFLYVALSKTTLDASQKMATNKNVCACAKQNVRKKHYKNRDKVGFHFSRILTHNQQSVYQSLLPSIRQKHFTQLPNASPTKNTKPTTPALMHKSPPAPTHANIQACLIKPFHFYLVVFRYSR
jgi:GTP cyclohydrolase FolE2